MSKQGQQKQRLDVEAVRAANPLQAVVENAGVALRKQGRDLFGCCPFHAEKTPSFKIDPIRQSWYCFGACAMGGDVFGFVEKLEGLDFVGALKYLATRGGVDAGIDPVLQEKRKLARETQLALWNEKKKADDEARRRSAYERWREGGPATGTLVEQYFESRDLPSGWVKRTGFRFHPAFWGEKLAMLAPVTDPVSGKFKGLHGTFLRPDGRGKADPRHQPGPKIQLGPVWGGWIKIGKDDGVSPLLIGEGIETTLSVLLAMESAGKPAIGRVGISLGNIARALSPAPPKRADRPLILLADNDMKDMEAAKQSYAEAAERWRENGWHNVRIAWPRPGMDFNDMAQSTGQQKEDAHNG
jgi:DNA primase